MAAARPWLVAALLVVGCSPSGAAVWVPTVSVRAAAVQSRDRRASAARSRWGWQVAVDTRWRLSRPEARVDDASPIEVSLPRPRVECADRRLCAWEREARRRALRRLNVRRNR